MGGEQFIAWCSHCHRLNLISHPATETFFDGYLPCQFCSGICLRLPDQFGEYAVSAFASLAQQEYAKAVPLAELGRVIGQIRAQHAAGAASDPIATVAASAPDLEDLLIYARDRDDLDAALLTLWILIGELLIATRDPSIAGLPDEESDSLAHLLSLHRIVTELSSSR
ncbi:hypothetical protein [Janibacter alittae]|uniref:Cytochrome c domain-containing protein n=1 Tax=Janibacter alittae TaxID=3115209 RepID=A0ABZ2MLT5_9MICO